jgi:choline dehydrogenase-like flavoprotein
MDKRFDVIIIGSGAGGGTIARCLAPSGKSILILERGDWLKREAKNWDAVAVFEKNRYISPDTWYDRDGRPFQPQVHYFVGGATKLFGAALYRLRERDFAELRHHDGISPAWPISYQDLEPYYTRAEEMYHVHGLRGGDPTEPPASGPYPCPPVSDEPRISQLRNNLMAAGYHPFAAPCAIMLNEANMAYSACIRCQTCDGFPCLVHAKSDAEVVAVRPALEFPNVTLIRNAKAVKLETNAAGTMVTRSSQKSRESRTYSAATLSSYPAVRSIAPNSCLCQPTTSTRTGLPMAQAKLGAITCSTTARLR